jgi:hypothetical protein
MEMAADVQIRRKTGRKLPTLAMHVLEFIPAGIAGRDRHLDTFVIRYAQ